MLRILRLRGVEVQPLISASAGSGGLLSPHCFARLKDELLGSLRKVEAPDAVLLGLHGSACGVGLEDPEDLINDLERALYRSQK